MDTMTYHVLDYDELEDLIKEHYPFIEDYNFIACEESSNDTSHTYDNISAESWDQYDDEQWEIDIVKDKQYDFAVEVFLRKLCKDGHIEPGNYLIHVCW
jgi:sulfatase maturation enzyme AslB (radical SAM superfamily)